MRCRVWLVLCALAARAHASAVRISHEGLYLNLPHTPLLVVYVNSSALRVDGAHVSVGYAVHRTAKDVAQCMAPPEYRGIHACSAMDLDHVPRSVVRTIHASQVQPDDGVAVPGALDALVPPTVTRSQLMGAVVTLEAQDMAGVNQTFRWWVGHLAVPPAERARWPLTPGEYLTRRGQLPNVEPRPWTGLDMPHLAGMMHDPLIPKAQQNATWCVARGAEVLTAGAEVSRCVSARRRASRSRNKEAWCCARLCMARSCGSVPTPGAARPQTRQRTPSWCVRCSYTNADPRQVGTGLPGAWFGCAACRAKWFGGRSRHRAGYGASACSTRAVHGAALVARARRRRDVSVPVPSGGSARRSSERTLGGVGCNVARPRCRRLDILSPAACVCAEHSHAVAAAV